MAYLLCECDTKHIRTQDISSSTGLSEKAIDTLISLRKMDSKLPDTISKILENKIYCIEYTIVALQTTTIHILKHHIMSYSQVPRGMLSSLRKN